ncbi:sulfatase-like hydrolase/transferase [Arthrobacter tecti]
MTRPNVLLIFSDDHGYADRSALGIHANVSTPALDSLATEGISCTEAYVTAPVCSPSRAGLLAGSYQARWGATWFGDSEVPPEEFPTIAERLSAEGYATGYFGKVHYGSEKDGDRGTPPCHGFDESFYGLAGQSLGRLHYTKRGKAAVKEYGDAARNMAVAPMWESTARGEAREVEDDGFLTELIGSRARDFMEKHREGPFFAYVAFNAVHNFAWQLPDEELQKRGLPPWEDWYAGAEEYMDWYDGAVAPNLPNGREYYLAQLELMDREIGRLLDSLKEMGVEDDTIVIYLTDNGGSNCNFGRNEPLTGTKYTLWEGGIRVPLIVRWPSELPAGGTREGIISSMDILPTVLAAAGVEPAVHDGVDGVDQLAFLRGDEKSARTTLHWDCGRQWAVRKGPWKARWADGESGFREALRATEKADIGEGLSLINLADDLTESDDLSERHPEVLRDLVQLHEAWRLEVGLDKEGR